MFKIRKAKDEEPTAPGQVKIKKRSKVPGVMITQYVEELPEGMTTPDFTRKPIAITIQEGKPVIFKAVVIGKPTPTVTWARNNGEINEERYQIIHDKSSGEYQLKMPDVCVDLADTYKCYARNEYGKAVVTATLNVIEVGFKKNRALQESRTAIREIPEDFKKALKHNVDIDAKEDTKTETDEKFWEVLMSADKKDYESICVQYGVTDFRGMLKKLNEKKIEREQQQEKVVERLCNLKPIELKSDGDAEFELEMSMRDPTSKIFLFKDGVMIPFDADTESKHGLKQVGKKFVFSINGVDAEDAGLYQVEVDGVKIFSTDFKLPPVDFLVKIQDVKAEEREDAVFECVISHPLKKITWMGKNVTLEQGEKYDILVSEDMLIHSLVVKDCAPLDKGIYAAVTGMASCSAWLIVEEQGVYFTSGLSDVTTIIGTNAELVCRLSNEECDGVWYKEGKEITATDNICIVKDGTFRKLIIKNCTEDDAGKYRCEADGRKTEAVLNVEDPPRITPEDLTEFIKPVTIKTGKDAAFKVTFLGREPLKIQWYNEGDELLEETHIKIEKSSSHSRLLLTKCQRKTTGEIKIKIKNECGTTEAITQLVVLDKPTPPLGPVDIIESSSACIDFKWRVPKDNGGSPITDYILERQQIGRNSWKKLGKIGPEPKYRDSDVDHGRKYCYHIRAETDHGISEMMETDDIQAGTKAYPGAPSMPKIVSAFKDCINLAWSAPTNTGGTNLFGYNVEKRKNGSNLWSQVNPPDQPIKEKKYAVKDVVEGIEYEFRVSAINISGAGEPSTPSEFVIARDPKKPPGKVIDLKVTDSTYTTLSLGWIKPTEEEGVQDEAKGYFVELRPAEDPEWGRCNSTAIIMNSYTIMGLKSMAMYWVRVLATNEGGDGEPQELDNYIIAMPPPVKPQFTDKKINNFMVMRAGNSVRINFNFQASPVPIINWLKDGLPVAKHVTVSNTDTSSQLIIAASERHDTGIYTIIVKNIVGQETSSVEIRVTDEPKPPGPVELDENVMGTVTVSWTPSPDEKKDDRLHYIITKRDSVKRSWQTVADHLFNNKFTAINIMPGRQYNFRVYAKNDMGLSKPSESAPWEVKRTKETFSLDLPVSKDCSFEMPPAFSVPLKKHNSPESYECYMSCAVTGNPRPHVTWYKNNISLNTNTNYYITNTCGVCSMVILKVDFKDSGEYTVMAENPLGRVECSTKLVVRD
ncbi:immunoglobulin-like and fibronectin type III domain-containing protein 1 [Labrus mixtus]|uniref:immunoglobulin-like and fibronectin type III domain-containing protein 1 n=1 Tax=Labrus mixtus TaxID=508554 RepID=UPI0029C0A7AF|nr:immunoglobulin-like and fibronectin type III domain-containing protein 1 [Labrus mixtus]